MGDEAKQEDPKPAPPAEQKPAEPSKAEEPSKTEEPPPPEEPKPPAPFVLYVDLHCVGCAKKIEKSIMKIRGVEGVTIDMAQNHVTIKGVVEPQAVCARIMKKTKRRAKVVSPLPAAEGEPMPEVVASQVSGLATVELNVDMHCQACADQLKRKIMKMRGVQTAVTEHATGKVTVTGTMDANKLVDYLYKRTKKQARIVPQPEPQPEPEPLKPGEKKDDGAGEAAPAAPLEEAKPAEEEKPAPEEGGNKEEPKKEEKEAEPNNDGGEEGHDQDGMKRMIYHYQPLYVIERMPPAPQLFSDENPNACSIS